MDMEAELGALAGLRDQVIDCLARHRELCWNLGDVVIRRRCVLAY
jgi:hypothetical protein